VNGGGGGNSEMVNLVFADRYFVLSTSAPVSLAATGQSQFR
jgi:hypothetical protein